MIEGQVAYIFISDKPKKKNFQAGMFLLHLGLVLLSLSYFEFETLAFCGAGNPFACSIRIRLTSWIASGFP